jgi:apolipoprotein N-acyltransferase
MPAPFFFLLLVTLLTLSGTSAHPLISFYLLGAVSFMALIWFIHGLRLRRRLAELVEVAAIRAGLQPLGRMKSGARK